MTEAPDEHKYNKIPRALNKQTGRNMKELEQRVEPRSGKEQRKPGRRYTPNKWTTGVETGKLAIHPFSTPT